ncbi:MAG: DUF1343 domain-containing protein [Bacteroidetes bacterium]|nr:DUF1343 domain-containing protein [Bacteroidota bacterium]
MKKPGLLAPQFRKLHRLLVVLLILPCLIPRAAAQILSRVEVVLKTDADVKTGAERTEAWFPLLKNKRVALVANHTSLIGKTHLADSMISMKINLVKVFAPEHGFRGSADAGEHVSNGKDSRTGLPLISLYGNNKKPGAEQLADVDVLVFDIQDVGARFYTYISTMSYVMEACAEQGKEVIILDRPNPNGHYVDGPVLDPKFSSFVGLHPVPVVHGMTVGEYAQMVNGEGWLKGGIKCKLNVITCEGWNHRNYYQVDVAPSPNLRTMNAIYLYPSLCFFEGTKVSVGRGTEAPFEMIGYPGCSIGSYSFTPASGPGSKSPMYEGKVCTGFNLRPFGENFVRDTGRLYLFWLVSLIEQEKYNPAFFNDFFDKLAGTDQLRKQLLEKKTEDEIRALWQPDLEKFRAIRKKYLLYPD